jgi:hypothetical protein
MPAYDYEYLERLGADEDGDDGVLRDGQARRIPLMLCDALQRSVAEARPAAFDAAAHRPGYRIGDAAAQDARNRAHAEYVRNLENAWKSPARLAADGECTEQAAREIMTDTAEDARERAYQDRKRWLSQAWRMAR